MRTDVSSSVPEMSAWLAWQHQGPTSVLRPIPCLPVQLLHETCKPESKPESKPISQNTNSIEHKIRIGMVSWQMQKP